MQYVLSLKNGLFFAALALGLGKLTVEPFGDLGGNEQGAPADLDGMQLLRLHKSVDRRPAEAEGVGQPADRVGQRRHLSYR